MPVPHPAGLHPVCLCLHWRPAHWRSAQPGPCLWASTDLQLLLVSPIWVGWSGVRMGGQGGCGVNRVCLKVARSPGISRLLACAAHLPTWMHLHSAALQPQQPCPSLLPPAPTPANPPSLTPPPLQEHSFRLHLCRVPGRRNCRHTGACAVRPRPRARQRPRGRPAGGADGRAGPQRRRCRQERAPGAHQRGRQRLLLRSAVEPTVWVRAGSPTRRLAAAQSGRGGCGWLANRCALAATPTLYSFFKCAI